MAAVMDETWRVVLLALAAGAAVAAVMALIL